MFGYESNKIERLVIKIVPFKLVQQIKVFCKKNRKFYYKKYLIKRYLEIFYQCSEQKSYSDRVHSYNLQRFKNFGFKE